MPVQALRRRRCTSAVLAAAIPQVLDRVDAAADPGSQPLQGPAGI